MPHWWFTLKSKTCFSFFGQICNLPLYLHASFTIGATNWTIAAMIRHHVWHSLNAKSRDGFRRTFNIRHSHKSLYGAILF